MHPLVPLPEARRLTRAGPATEWHVLSGWGESVRGWSRVLRPRSSDQVADLLARARAAGSRLCLRGAGRSYGDASILPRGDVLDLTGLNRIRSFDEETGEVVAECGVSIEQLWRAGIGRGFWPAVVPGTMHPTVGGCLAMNIHGKNQYRVGGFGEHVTEIEVAFSSGEVRTVHARRDRELFRAVVGGFGLLGVITSARIKMRRISSGRLRVAAVTCPTLEDMVRELDARAADSDYLVGWLDCFHARNRGVVHAARHFEPGEDPQADATLAASAQELPPRLFGVVPRELVAPLMSPLANDRGMRLVNAAKYRSASFRAPHRFDQPHGAFSFLLDYVPGWKRIYQPGGLIQHQSFVPAASALQVHTELLDRCRSSGLVPWLGVYKKHRADDFLMSHCVDGFSLALDFAVTSANRERLWKLCRDMDEIVLAASGGFYLAKDLTASPSALERSYPGLPRFREWKQELDPDGVLTSALAVRLGVLSGGPRG